MALVSPGIQVTITDESFYVSSGPGTVPLIFIVTKEDKPSPDGLGVAPGTLAGNADRLFLISSQRELLQTFGNPDFSSIGGTAQHGNELNEYGLLAAHSYLGVANRAYVIRSNLDLGELEPTTVAPTGDPVDLTYWVDLNGLVPGLFVSTGAGTTNWVPVDVTLYAGEINDGDVLPASGFVDGDVVLAIDPNTSGFSFFLRDSGEWEQIEGTVASHINVPVAAAAGEYWLKTTTPNQGTSVDLKVYDAEIGQFVDVPVTLAAGTAAYYASNPANAVPAGTVIGVYDGSAAPVDLAYDLYWHNGASTVTVASTAAVVTTDAGNININGDVVAITAPTPPLNSLEQAVADINAAGVPNIVASESNGFLVLTNTAGEDIVISGDAGTLSDLNLVAGTYSNFTLIHDAAPAYVVSAAQPTGGAEDGALWYNPAFLVDILVNDGAGNWDELSGDLFVQPDQPTGVAGDLWVETDQLVDYPVIRRYDGVSWVLIDNADQTTPNGIVFADARPDNSGALDADAPDPLLYPGGTLLWNTRYSTRNVKQWTPGYTFQGNLVGDRWVTVSGNNIDGTPITGRAAVKKVITDRIASTILTNDEVRADTIFFNLIAAPGYPELIDEMLTLNVDRKESAFVIGDTPFSLNPSSTSLQAWATNANNAPSNGDLGLVSSSEYLGVYYPSGLTTNVDGTEVVVPASHMVLRVMAFNDQVAYPWFAPAGFQRGTVTNATSVGYLTAQDEFIPLTLNQGQRDVLYLNNVNSIVNIPGRGLVVFGQKTRSNVESALDRINVARLVNYIRFQAERIAEPFLFEPNDSQTRAAVAERYETFLAELVTLRGVFDFLVVVDETNNTPARIDRNELWVDIAISPTKAAEFIYIPIRIRNTGADLSL